MSVSARIAGIALAAAWFAGAALAQTTQQAPKTTRPVFTAPDLLKGAIDPYNAIEERLRFFKAAGPDNELDEKEFSADAARKNGFVRKFDRWKAMLTFDKKGNKTIDWFEAKAYRLDLRKRLLAKYDANKDGKLTGPERAEANRALLAGKIPGPPRVTSRPVRLMPDPRRPRPAGPEVKQGRVDEWYMKILEKYDKDGDGQLNDEERMRYLADQADQRRKERLAKYDLDGDGKLSDEEKAAAKRDRRRPMKMMMEQMKLLHFDTDNDGKINEDEKAQFDAFSKSMTDMNKRWRKRLFDFDTDGDGEVSPEERQAGTKELRKMGWRMMVRMMRAMDADGDGKVGLDEQSGFMEHMQERTSEWLEKFMNKFDADGDGRILKPNERKALLEGMDDEFEARVKKHDKNADGRLDVTEAEDLITDFISDLGILGKDETRRPRGPRRLWRRRSERSTPEE